MIIVLVERAAGDRQIVACIEGGIHEGHRCTATPRLDGVREDVTEQLAVVVVLRSAAREVAERCRRRRHVVEDLIGRELAAVPRAERREERVGDAVDRLDVEVVLGWEAHAGRRDDVDARHLAVARQDVRRIPVCGESVRAGISRAVVAVEVDVDLGAEDVVRAHVTDLIGRGRKNDAGAGLIRRSRVLGTRVAEETTTDGGRAAFDVGGEERVPGRIPDLGRVRGDPRLDVGRAAALGREALDEGADAARGHLVLVEIDLLAGMRGVRVAGHRERAAAALVLRAGLADLAEAAGVAAEVRRAARCADALLGVAARDVAVAVSEAALALGALRRAWPAAVHVGLGAILDAVDAAGGTSIGAHTDGSAVGADHVGVRGAVARLGAGTAAVDAGLEAVADAVHANGIGLRDRAGRARGRARRAARGHRDRGPEQSQHSNNDDVGAYHGVLLDSVGVRRPPRKFGAHLGRAAAAPPPGHPRSRKLRVPGHEMPDFLDRPHPCREPDTTARPWLSETATRIYTTRRRRVRAWAAGLETLGRDTTSRRLFMALDR